MSQSDAAHGLIWPECVAGGRHVRPFLVDPSSVSESWREFFADYRPGPRAGAAAAPPASAAPGPAPQPGRRASPPPTPVRRGPGGRPVLRGAASRIVANMEASLAVPTATSVRRVPARLLEVNRQILNNQLARTTGAKVSFTHLIGYAVVQGPARRARPERGLRDDADGKRQARGSSATSTSAWAWPSTWRRATESRTLLVPCIRDADTLDFRSFVVAYEDLVRKIHTSKVSPDDFAGTTVTPDQPGHAGHGRSRCPGSCPGKAPSSAWARSGCRPASRRPTPGSWPSSGVGKAVTLTSTYDHRIIQGAESGIFLGGWPTASSGSDGFYDGSSTRWASPTSPSAGRSTATPATAPRPGSTSG